MNGRRILRSDIDIRNAVWPRNVGINPLTHFCDSNAKWVSGSNLSICRKKNTGGSVIDHDPARFLDMQNVGCIVYDGITETKFGEVLLISGKEKQKHVGIFDNSINKNGEFSSDMTFGTKEENGEFV